jgi:putative transposase
MPRLVVPNYPHHVTQRGNRRQQTFFVENDYRTYLAFIAESMAEVDAAIWAYCLMPNHVHFVIVPTDEDALAGLFSNAHRRYTRHINHRHDWRGHLWQERFHSVVMDEQHLIATVRYVELNPVRAGLCANPSDWRWSRVHAHLRGRDDEGVAVDPMLGRIKNGRDYLQCMDDDETLEQLREHSRTGRPLGDQSFLDTLVDITGIDWRKRKPGPVRKDK